MTTLDPTTLDPGQLAVMLTAWADGDHAGEAAVGLLTHAAGGIWLRHRAFLTACVDAIDDGWTRDGLVPMAAITWDQVPGFLAAGVAASSGEISVLRAAASLAGVDVGSLREVTSSLDHSNLGQVLDAVAHRAGWHEHAVTRTVTGHQHSVGLVNDPGRLPTWEDIRFSAYAVLGDAQDWLRSDWRPDAGPTPAAAQAMRRAVKAITIAKTHLNLAAASARDGR